MCVVWMLFCLALNAQDDGLRESAVDGCVPVVQANADCEPDGFMGVSEVDGAVQLPGSSSVESGVDVGGVLCVGATTNLSEEKDPGDFEWGLRAASAEGAVRGVCAVAWGCFWQGCRFLLHRSEENYKAFWEFERGLAAGVKLRRQRAGALARQVHANGPGGDPINDGRPGEEVTLMSDFAQWLWGIFEEE